MTFYLRHQAHSKPYICHSIPFVLLQTLRNNYLTSMYNVIMGGSLDEEGVSAAGGIAASGRGSFVTQMKSHACNLLTSLRLGFNLKPHILRKTDIRLSYQLPFNSCDQIHIKDLLVSKRGGLYGEGVPAAGGIAASGWGCLVMQINFPAHTQ